VIRFVFEKEDRATFFNFTDCKDLNASGIPRFTPSPVVSELYLHTVSKLGGRKIKIPKIRFITKIPKNGKYIIASGVAHSPDVWTGKFPKKVVSQKTVFELIKPEYLRDLQSGRAFLLLDQSHEGYHEEWLWEWFHSECERFDVSPTQVIYITGDMSCADQYKQWAAKNNITEYIKPIPYPHFEYSLSGTIGMNILPTGRDHFTYKKENKSKIKTYNCLQKRPRNHRAWLFSKLYAADLLDSGINSMNEVEYNYTYMDGKTVDKEVFDEMEKFLPMLPPTDSSDKIDAFASHDCGEYLMKINSDIMLDSWISVISEASFSDSLNTCFLSEKTFKPIAAQHPFIIFGNRHSLKYLHSLGYKTFAPYINEDYDSLPTWERLDAIVDEIDRINKMSDKEKMKMLKALTPVLAHNKNVLGRRSLTVPKNIQELFNYIEG